MSVLVATSPACPSASVGADDLLAAAAALRSALASFDPQSLRGPECVRVAEALAETEKCCAATRLMTAAAAVDAGAHLSLGFKDGASWLALQSGTTRHRARRDLDVADRLEDCPDTRAAFLAGEVSKDAATEIVEAEKEMSGVEAELLDQARHSDLSKLRDAVRDLRQARTPVEDLHAHQHRARSFRHWRDRLGMVCFTGRLTPELGVPLIARLEAAAAEAKRAARAADGSAEPEKWEAYAADAFAQMCAANDDGQKRSARTELVIVCDLGAWRRGHTHDGDVCHIIGGGPIPVQVAKDLSHDAFLKAVLHDGTDIRTVKHFGRHYKAELRTALDLGPVPAFTGRQCAQCGSRWGLQYDHVDPVANQGPTSYDNIQALCWDDHHTKTERDRKAGLLTGHRRQHRSPDDNSPDDS